MGTPAPAVVIIIVAFFALFIIVVIIGSGTGSWRPSGGRQRKYTDVPRTPRTSGRVKWGQRRTATTISARAAAIYVDVTMVFMVSAAEQARLLQHALLGWAR